MNYKKISYLMQSSWLCLNNLKYIERYYNDSLLEFNIEKEHKKNNNQLNYKNTEYCNVDYNQEINLIKLSAMINFFRKNGHKYAQINPLYKNMNKIPNLCESNDYFIKYNNIKSEKNIPNYIKKYRSLNTVFKILKETYCSYIGIEFSHLDNDEEIKWIQNNFENIIIKDFFTESEKKKFLKEIIYAATFEQYLNSQFPGSKRFSLEGCEVLVPILKYIISFSKNIDSKRIILGMAHRGRLNVLANVLKKNISTIIQEFKGKACINKKGGDVKYHLGYERIIQLDNGNELNVSLKYNPSHLELIYPVLLGTVRSYLDKDKNMNTNNIIPIIIHGDASITGQGVVQESLNMSQTKSFSVGGIIHIIINNQIGFTTSNIDELRSTQYCTDIAKMINTPVLHVNADSVESAMFAIQFAVKYRMQFKKDIFIDLFSYRRNGHNETDEPRITQPLMYQIINNHPSISVIYNNQLISENIISKNFFNVKKNNYLQKIQKSIINEQNISILKKRKHNVFIENKITKKLSLKNLTKLFNIINHIPMNINMHPLVNNIFKKKISLLKQNNLIDWSSAENLAYAAVLNEGISCRLSGQDVNRGTFFHRHINIHDQKTGKVYTPLKNINNLKSRFFSYNSVLSEESVLGFEYGYSSNQLHTLNIWEAQFGDFTNGAQNIIDQFIVSGNAKWGENSNLIMLLPHGYEGQGPEHSSARIERFLQLCANNNIELCIPTTASQIFHLIYSQIFREKIIPRIIFTPKSMLRNPLTYSSIDDLSNSKFLNIIIDNDVDNYNKIYRIIFCAGKIFYDLLNFKKKYNCNNISIIRIERLYPFPITKVKKIVEKYFFLKELVWCQEEPKNQGAWNYIYHILKKIICNLNTQNNIKIKYIGRPESASTATGYFHVHDVEQSIILKKSMNII
ncbi:2-oxoglutarate dehydrogenase E1 component [Buchnera aphidicola (Thelaxes suberi)]|uniref:2-oxoglutarate dehydrogenase E1 component n=1 Tax=Buchnera aphidicola TaxID=9 RepID=UPI0034638937